MSLQETFEQLISEGEKLVPLGGTQMKGFNGSKQPDYVSWRLQAISAIQELGESARPILKDLDGDDKGPYFYTTSAARVLGCLKGALALFNRATRNSDDKGHRAFQGGANLRAKVSVDSTKVFIVHGHDQALLQQTARFLEKLDLQPIVLFEQAARGQTIIEKLETHGDVTFAIVLLSPDDLGKAASDEQFQPRARQNVVLELGYFLGRLSRPHVAVLYHESVELPSDYHGVEYIKIDAGGAWSLKLARELKVAGLPIDLNKVI